MPGYSAAPLQKKLGLAPPLTLVVVAPPPDYLVWLGDLPAGVRIVPEPHEPLQAVHIFATRRADLGCRLAARRTRLQPRGFLWVSWPKKASKVESDLTEDVIRALALPLGFVDIKVCAVSDVWSGLKLVIRKDKRGA